MATVFDKLKYFFNTENIVKRDVGKGKVVYKKIHKTSGESQQSFHPSGLYTKATGRNSMFIGQNESKKTGNSDRFARYEEYNAMDTDSLVAGVLDIYSEDATTINSEGEVLRIVSKNDTIVNILTNLFYDILKIEFNLSDWIRQTLKYGDFFIQLEIDDKYGIVGFQPILPHLIEIQLEVVQDENGETLKPVYYLIENNTSKLYGNEKKNGFENYELIHFKYKQDELFYPYSKSLLEAGRRTWSEIKLMEDSMLVYNITRAPSKRAFFVNVGNLPPKDLDPYMENIVSSVKRENIIDSEGKVNLRYNIENIMDDFFIPVRGSGDTSRIETIDGGGEWDIEPLEYLKDKMLASFKVPKSYLGYEEDLSGKATLAGEDIRFARSVRTVQKMFIDQLTKIAMIHLYVQGFKMSELLDFELELTNPSTIHEKQQLEVMSEKLNITRDAMESNVLSSEWVYRNIWDMNDYEVEEIKQQIAKDKQLQWKFQSIEDSGELPEPGETAESDWGNEPEEDNTQESSSRQSSFQDMDSKESNVDSGTFKGQNPSLNFENYLKKYSKKRNIKNKKERLFEMLQNDIQQDLNDVFKALKEDYLPTKAKDQNGRKMPDDDKTKA